MKLRRVDSGLLVPVEPPPTRRSHYDILAIYDELHAVCPECKSDDYESTCMGFYFTDLETAVDRNHIRCSCGWSGIAHELVPEPRKATE